MPCILFFSVETPIQGSITHYNKHIGNLTTEVHACSHNLSCNITHWICSQC
jgi:hypothetical protein